MPETSISEGLVKAYRATDYRVLNGEASFALRIGATSPELTELYRRTGQGSAVFITAENPFSVPFSAPENAANLELLRRQLATLSPLALEGEGQGEGGEWPAERSLFALGIGREQACALGIQYRQNAIVWADADAIPELILLR